MPFSDTQKYWAEDCVQHLGEQKLITGYPDGSFRPDATVTRAETAVLLLHVFRDASIKRSVTTFKDVPANYWLRNLNRRTRRY